MHELDVEGFINRLTEQRRREETLTCPYCGFEFDFSDDFPSELVTYWDGDGTEEEVACPSCDKDFMATETVRRTYESRPKTDDDP